MILEYFGTDLTSAGHYFFILNSGFGRSNRRYDLLPFNAEALPFVNGESEQYNVGITSFHQCFGFTIYAICGSPKDGRPGCKSVFFVQANLTEPQMKDLITSSPTAMQIINGLNQPVQWQSTTNPQP